VLSSSAKLDSSFSPSPLFDVVCILDLPPPPLLVMYDTILLVNYDFSLALASLYLFLSMQC
jgi:hypothetical protein